MIEAALIRLPARADESIFGRPLLERLVILCRRAGIPRFIIEIPTGQRHCMPPALQGLKAHPTVEIVDSLRTVRDIDAGSPCIRFSGNLVLAQSQLVRILTDFRARDGKALTVFSTDNEHGGRVMVGPLAQIVNGEPSTSAPLTWRPGHEAESSKSPFRLLPFALNGRPEDRVEAEVRLARAVRNESLETDALMARMVDRRLSWRFSLRLARTRITPNEVTITNTGIGLGCAAMLASTSYWLRVGGALLFLLCITLDGVDGELARLRMIESPFGQRLDVLTDNLVHVAVFIGMAVGCYRLSASTSYFYALAILLVGFGACAVSVNRALSIAGSAAERWIGQVERATGRDFAYLVFILAVVNRLYYFVWGTAFGTHVFAATLWWFTNRYRRNGLPPIASGPQPTNKAPLPEHPM